MPRPPMGVWRRKFIIRRRTRRRGNSPPCLPIRPMIPCRSQEHISIAWPLDTLHKMYGDQGFAGFLMPRVSGMRPLFNVYNPSTRRQELPLFNYLYLHRAARNVSSAVRALHNRGYVIGDINEFEPACHGNRARYAGGYRLVSGARRENRNRVPLSGRQTRIHAAGTSGQKLSADHPRGNKRPFRVGRADFSTADGGGASVFRRVSGRRRPAAL